MAESPKTKSQREKPPIKAVGGVVYRERAGRHEVLLIRKRNGYWTLPKGRIKAGEADHDALVRELHEETGLYGQIGSRVQQVEYTITKGGRPRYKMVTYYVVQAQDGALQLSEKEGIELARWFPLRAALRRIRRPRIRAVTRAACGLLRGTRAPTI